MNTTLAELVNIADKVSPLPAVAKKAIDLLRQTEPNLAKLADVITTDQVLAGLMLRWANSASSGLKLKVTSVRQAILYLGLTTVKSVILMQGFSGPMAGPVPNYGFSKGELWRRSVGMAAGARLLMQKYGLQMAEDAYNTGLMSDIGLLSYDVLFTRQGIHPDPSRCIRETEEEISGTDHAQLGAAIARHWEFPTSVQDAIFYRYVPLDCPEEKHRLLACANHVAHCMFVRSGMGAMIDCGENDPRAFALLNVTETDLDDLYEQVLPFLAESEILVGLSI